MHLSSSSASVNLNSTLQDNNILLLGVMLFLVLVQIMIIDFKLTYPSGTATAHLINSFHTPQGAKLAK